MVGFMLLEGDSEVLYLFGHADVTGENGITLLEKDTGLSDVHGMVDVTGASIDCEIAKVTE